MLDNNEKFCYDSPRLEKQGCKSKKEASKASKKI